MSVHAHCEGCGASFTLADAMAGKKVRCKHCQQPITVPSGTTLSASNKPAAPPQERPIKPRDKNPPIGKNPPEPGKFNPKPKQEPPIPPRPVWTVQPDPGPSMDWTAAVGNQVLPLGGSFDMLYPATPSSLLAV